MRVIVPFGPRNIQGFVAELKTESEFKQLREIIEPMDLEPVLNQELLALGSWLTENTLCFKIFAFQAMLPAALKAKYEKNVKLSIRNRNKCTPVIIATFFRKGWKTELARCLRRMELYPMFKRKQLKVISKSIIS